MRRLMPIERAAHPVLRLIRTQFSTMVNGSEFDQPLEGIKGL